MNRGRRDARPDPADDRPDAGANPSSGIARREGDPGQPAGGPVDATLRGDPGTPQAMGLGSEPADDLDDPESTLDAGDRTD